MQYRLSCRAISIIHMLWVAFQTLGAFSAVLGAGNISLNEFSKTEILLGLLLLCVLSGFQIFGAWKLFNGTKRDVSPQSGLNLCRTWRIITLVAIGFSTLGIVALILQGRASVVEVTISIVHLGLLVFAVWYVKRYINQLQAIWTLPTVDSAKEYHKRDISPPPPYSDQQF